MFNPKKEDNLTKALNYAKEKVDDIYNSSYYDSAWNRYEKRLKAYKMIHDTNAPKWKSKLHFPVFRMGVKSLKAQFTQSHRLDPFITVSAEQSVKFDQEAIEKAKIAQYDLNHDLYLSRFSSLLDSAYHYLCLFGTAVGREYITSDTDQEMLKSVTVDRFGVETGVTTEEKVTRIEHTKTDLIHPLNFAHDITKPHVFLSRWASVRFPMPISLLYKMRKSNNKLVNKAGIDKIIKAIEDGKEPPNWTSQKDKYYSENSDKSTYNKGSIIVNEYSGDLNYSGNYDDNNLYLGIYSKDYDVWITIGQSPYKRHPYWKLQGSHDPQGIYGDGLNDELLPVNYWKNTTINQNIDYTNSTLKYMYEAYAGNILGGMNTFLDGLPGGMVFADNEEAFIRGGLVRPVQHSQGALNGVERMMQFIEGEIQRVGAVGNFKTEAPSVTDTATGVSAMMQREASLIEAYMDEVDRNGIEDAMQMKMANRITYLTEPIIGSIEEGSPAMRYFPFELGGSKFAYYIKRQTPDVVAGKQMSFLKLVSQIAQLQTTDGQPLVKPERMLGLVKDIGKNFGVDRVDEYLPEPTPMPPQQPNPMAGMQGQGQPPTSPQGGVNAAMAMA